MMRELREDERNFLWEILEKGEKRSSGKKGYVTFRYKNKNYKRSRILYQIYYNIFLYPDEIIHHIDENKTNDKITNLKLCENAMEHSFEHKRFTQDKNSQLKKV